MASPLLEVRIQLPKILLSDIRHDKSGFEELTNLYAKAKEYTFETIQIDMNTTAWLDADMCSSFGAILYHVTSNLNNVDLVNLQPQVESILLKNRFLSHYGKKSIVDSWKTTIKYRHFDVKDGRSFAEYVESEFIDRDEVPKMSIGLKKKFKESIFEIFSNSVLHSKTKLGIFTCGQFFPKRNSLNFSISDLGIGIRTNIKESIGINLQADEAIVWATRGSNTTKKGEIPGGLGLKLLCEFIDLNGGRIQIVSENGYFCRENSSYRASQLLHPFPGTVVNIEIATHDDVSYTLSEEISPTDIF
ncbi:hypothetical protein Lrub_0286 [Legionella rubrilucens]|uniref:Uncharacterized protein n=1 Tax=Legionella rubrilucens TaxID=458 RepID=A0A0W0XZT5_9GAMM|nr:ATP-binding protein [Legionella rubrilucens]KTD49844.1 hypothetical protein Lrub_0286 [Legionella rubrilucens]